MRKLHRITNHPVHIFDEEDEISPSAFIPFCQFGKNLSAMGRETAFYKFPVCNSFKAKIFFDQLCYEVDVNDILKRDSYNIPELKLGLSLLVDTNFNRQYSLMKGRNDTIPEKETIGI